MGVARRYCGQLGKQDNCQVAVSLSLANKVASLPIAYRLYLTQAWADDPERRRRSKVPPEVVFQTKPQIALDQIAAAKARGIAPGTILADAGYGADGGFRGGLSTVGLAYVVGVQPTLNVWRPGEGPLPPKPWSGKGRPPSLVRRSPDQKPISVKALAEELDADTWHTVRWRERTNVDLSSVSPPCVYVLLPGLQSIRAASGGMFDGRMARRCGCAEQILALDPAAQDLNRRLSRQPSCVGGSNETIRISNKTSG